VSARKRVSKEPCGRTPVEFGTSTSAKDGQLTDPGVCPEGVGELGQGVKVLKLLPVALTVVRAGEGWARCVGG